MLLTVYALINPSCAMCQIPYVAFSSGFVLDESTKHPVICHINFSLPWKRTVRARKQLAELHGTEDNKFPAFYVTRLFIAVFTRARHWTIS
jgi:hypothetical protein